MNQGDVGIQPFLRSYSSSGGRLSFDYFSREKMMMVMLMMTTIITVIKSNNKDNIFLSHLFSYQQPLINEATAIKMSLSGFLFSHAPRRATSLTWRDDRKGVNCLSLERTERHSSSSMCVRVGQWCWLPYPTKSVPLYIIHPRAVSSRPPPPPAAGFLGQSLKPFLSRLSHSLVRLNVGCFFFYEV